MFTILLIAGVLAAVVGGAAAALPDGLNHKTESGFYTWN